MPRPRGRRWVSMKPTQRIYGPLPMHLQDIPPGVLNLDFDELEAVRLADLEGMHQTEGAQIMGVSRPTFGRILASARRKIAEALIEERLLHVNGGNVEHRQRGPAGGTPRRGRGPGRPGGRHGPGGSHGRWGNGL